MTNTATGSALRARALLMIHFSEDYGTHLHHYSHDEYQSIIVPLADWELITVDRESGQVALTAAGDRRVEQMIMAAAPLI